MTFNDCVEAAEELKEVRWSLFGIFAELLEPTRYTGTT